MQYIVALDQGTTSSRAIVFDHDGRIVGMTQREFEQIFPQPGWVEHNPREIWASQVGVMSEVLTKLGIRHRDIAAVGITNQRETTIVWDRRTGEPIYNAIVWQDRRTADICDRLRDAGHEALFRQKTGLVLDAYFSGTKIRWILDNVDGAREKARAGHLACGTVDSWLAWNLTRGRLHITDASNASRYLLYNIHTGQWDQELLDVLDIPLSMLPEVRSSSEVYGSISKRILSNPPPLAGIAGDQQAALFGQMCTQPGMVKNTYGTGCFLLMHTGDQPKASAHNLLTTVAWRIGERTEYALEGSVFMGGAVVQWLRDGLKLISSAADVERLAASVPDNGGVLFVPAFAGLGAPHWDPYARGVLMGLTRGVNAGHLARAALEGIALQSMDVICAMEADTGMELSELRVDGGATANNLLMQIQADLLRTRVVRPRVKETTALGAAYLAGLAVDYWEGLEALSSQWSADRIFEPEIPEAQVAELRGRWLEAVGRSKSWVSH